MTGSRRYLGQISIALPPSAQQLDITILQGETWRHFIELKGLETVDEAGNNIPINLSGWQFQMTFRRYPSARGNLLDLEGNNYIRIDSANDGRLIIEIPHNLTSQITASGVYDVKAIAPGGDRVFLFLGNYTLIRTATRT